MNAFIDEHCEALGIEPICKVLQVAPSAYRRYAAEKRDPTRRCARARLDETLMAHIERVWNDKLQVYGADMSGSSSSAKALRWRAARSSGSCAA